MAVDIHDSRRGEKWTEVAFGCAAMEVRLGDQSFADPEQVRHQPIEDAERRPQDDLPLRVVVGSQGVGQRRADRISRQER